MATPVQSDAAGWARCCSLLDRAWPRALLGSRVATGRRRCPLVPPVPGTVWGAGDHAAVVTACAQLGAVPQFPHHVPTISRVAVGCSVLCSPHPHQRSLGPQGLLSLVDGATRCCPWGLLQFRGEAGRGGSHPSPKYCLRGCNTSTTNTPLSLHQGCAGPKSLLPLTQGHSQAGKCCPPPRRASGLLFAHTSSQITVKSSLALRAGFACAHGLRVGTRAQHRALTTVPGRATEVSKTSQNLSEPQVRNGWDWECPQELREHGMGWGAAGDTARTPCLSAPTAAAPSPCRARVPWTSGTCRSGRRRWRASSTSWPTNGRCPPRRYPSEWAWLGVTMGLSPATPSKSPP